MVDWCGLVSSASGFCPVTDSRKYGNEPSGLLSAFKQKLWLYAVKGLEQPATSE
jgi:hypothetical protein